jgi:methionyl-tRNA formyltransferase
VKLVILTASRFGTASDCLPLLCESRNCEVVGVIVSQGLALHPWRKWQRKLLKISHIGLAGALNGIRMRDWYRPSTVDIVPLSRGLGIPVFDTDYTNGSETRHWMKRVSADLGLSLGNSYISDRVFTVPRYGMINVHGERLPEYQNAQSVIWPIYNLERTTGLTVHQIDSSIDTGNILYREEFPIRFCPTLEQTVRSTVSVIRQRIPAAVRHVCDSYFDLAANAQAQSVGHRFTTPNIRQYLRMVRNNDFLYRQISQNRVATNS